MNAVSTMHTPPEDYGDPVAEFEAGHTSAALLDVSDRAQVEIRGGDRVTFLHNFCTNDIQRLSPGEWCEAFVTNVKGRVLGHVFVFVEADAVRLDTVAGADDVLIAHLDRYLITEDVQLRSRTAELGEFFFTGPRAEAAVRAVRSDRLQPVDEDEVRVHHVDWFHQPGFLITFPREISGELWEQITKGDDCRPAGSRAFHALRIEAGFPLYGRDITEDNLAQEVGRTDRAISFTKGCYLGQEPIARIDAMGHVNRELRRLTLEHGPPPEDGAKIVADDRQEIGRVTSAVQLTDASQPLALGYLRSRFTKAGTTVRVEHEGDLIQATVL